jgi:uncharacterized protein
MATLTVDLPMEEIAALCREYHVLELSVFGSALRNDFREDSDLDLLVLFDPNAGIGFLELAALQRKLAAVISRPVDLVSKRGLNPVIRQDVLDSSMVIYGQE